MSDGLYRVVAYGVCAGFLISNGQVVACAPILRRRFSYWLRFATLIQPTHLDS